MLFSDALPSRTLPYSAKVIEVELFKPKQLALISKAIMLDNIGPAIEAMGSVLSGIDIEDLTVGDFYFLMTWQRLNCFTRNPLTASWQCNGAMFNDIHTNKHYKPEDVKALVESWNNADEEARKSLVDPDTVELDAFVCSYHNMANVTFSDFTVQHLADDVVLDSRLDYPRCGTLAEFVELQSDPDVGMLADAAQWIRGGTLRERINNLMEEDTTELFELACEANRDIRHGILRTLYKPCASCGHKHEINFVIEPRSFFL